MPRTSLVLGASSLFGLVACALLGVLPGDGNVVLLPMAAAATLALAFLALVGVRGGGPWAPLELGPVYIAVVSVYTLYPLLGFLVNGQRYGELNDNRLFALQPGAADVARVAWVYVAHLAGFAAAYLAARGRAPEARLGARPVPRLTVATLGALWLATQVYAFALARHYDWRFETNLDRYVALAKLPLLVAQVTGHLGAIRFTCEVALLVLLFAAARRPLLFVVPGIAFVAAMTFLQHQSRTELVLLTLAAVVCFHLEVRPLSIRVLSALAAAGLAVFVYLGATRDAGSSGGGGVRGMFVANEFESLFGNACDHEARVANGEIRSVPPGFFFADVLAPVPQQALSFAKVLPADWYMRTFLPEAAEQGINFCFGTIAESVVGGGRADAFARGAALGILFGALHGFVARRRPGPWWFIFYVWLTVLAYNSFRMSTFHLLVRTVYDFLPVVLGVKGVAWSLGLARRGTPAIPATTAVL